MSNNKDYLKRIELDQKQSHDYYLKSVDKTEHQKFLEKYLRNYNIPMFNNRIADIACGYGTLTFHLAKKYPGNEFTLLDLNEKAINGAKNLLSGTKNVTYHVGDMLKTPFPDDYFGIVFCWHTLSWTKYPEHLLAELIRITDKGGSVFISSLFNFDHDVDIYSQVYDRTRKSSALKLDSSYNTYSTESIEEWISDNCSDYELIPMPIEIDLEKTSRGLGTYTIKTIDSKRLQVSGGSLMSWGLLVISK